MLLTLAIISVLLVIRLKLGQYRSRETALLHDLQLRQEHLRKIWGQCFRETFDHEESILERKKEIQGTFKRLTRCKVGFVSQNQVCVPCPHGTFSLEQWITCTPLLTCTEMTNDVRIGSNLHTVGRWTLHSARWNNYDIMYSLLNSGGSKLDEFDSVQSLMPHDNFLYAIGHCNGKQTTQVLFARSINVLGQADNLDMILAQKPGCDNAVVRFRLAMDYVQILAHLHGNKSRAFVLCNSHSLSHLLSQFLITSSLRLALGAYDNLPVLNASAEGVGGKVKCSQGELKGSFVAPEQEWPHQLSKVFDYAQQPGYTEKADVWKIPDVTQAFLGKSSGSRDILDLLEVMHRKCKSLEPSGRPTAAEMLQEYQFIWKTLGLEMKDRVV